MIGTLKHDEAAGYIVEYQHQLSATTKQRKELQLHPDDLDLISSFAPEEEVSFYIVENQKMSGTVQYAKLITESHSDQVIDIINDEKSSEISDEEIKTAAEEYAKQSWGVYFNDKHPDIVIDKTTGEISMDDFINACKWYREQLKLKS